MVSDQTKGHSGTSFGRGLKRSLSMMQKKDNEVSYSIDNRSTHRSPGLAAHRRVGRGSPFAHGAGAGNYPAALDRGGHEAVRRNTPEKKKKVHTSIFSQSGETQIHQYLSFCYVQHSINTLGIRPTTQRTHTQDAPNVDTRGK